MARRTLTDTERAERTARIALLAAAAELVEQNRPADIDKAAAILGKYSRKNIGMILAQAAERGRDIPQAVAGFHDWRKAGRIVRKGAKGYAIFAPVTRGQDDDGTTRVGFTVRYVFDVADTDPLAVDSPATLRESLTESARL
jgi:hypothetical protein